MGRAFVGRRGELEELLAAFAAAASGSPTACLLAGEPGIGKTGLARELAAHAQDAGAVVRWGRAWEGGGAPPYWPWIEVLRAEIEAQPAERLRALLGDGAADLASLVPEILRSCPDVEPGAFPDSDRARFRLFDSVASFLGEVAADEPRVIVLDDLHAADAGTILLARFVARSARAGRILLVGTYRDVEARLREDVATPIAELAREARVLQLGALSPAEVRELLASLRGGAPDDATVQLVVETSEGVPLFVEQFSRYLTAEGGLARAGRALPLQARDVIRGRLDALGADTLAILTVAATIGREFDPTLLARALGRDLAGIAPALSDAGTAGILTVPAEPLGRYGFAHALFRDALYASLTPAEAADAHARIGLALESSSLDERERHLPTLAYHFAKAAPAGHAQRAFDFASAAGRQALERLAYEEAEGHFALALQLAGPTGAGERDRCRLLLDLGRARMRAGHVDAAIEALEDAAELARTLGLHRELGGIALEYAPDFSTGVEEPRKLALLREALDAVGPQDPALRARLLSRYAVALFPADASGRRAAAEEALALARSLGDPAVLAEAIIARASEIFEPGAHATRLALVEEALALAEQARDADAEMQARWWRAVTLLELGDGEGYEREAERYRARAEQLHAPLYGWYAALLDGERALLQGDFERALRSAAEGFELSVRARRPDGITFWGAQQGGIHLARGDLGALVPFEDAYRATVRQSPHLTLVRCGLIMIAHRLGRRDEARAEMDALAAGRFALSARDRTYPGFLAVFTITSALVGDERYVEQTYEELLPYEGIVVTTARGSTVYGPASALLAWLASAAGRVDDALAHAERAVREAAALRSPTFVALAHLAQGRALIGAGRREAAAAALREAIELFERHAMPARAEEARALLEAAGAAAPEAVFAREGDAWTVGVGDRVARVKHSKGMGYLAELLRRPGDELHAVELAAAPAHGDTGPMLDARAKAAYAERLRALEEERADAEALGDDARAARARAESEAIVDELSRALGLGGRDRTTGSASERARLNVTRAVRAAIERIATHLPDVGAHLDASVRTGSLCSYAPEQPAPAWRVETRGEARASRP